MAIYCRVCNWKRSIECFYVVALERKYCYVLFCKKCEKSTGFYIVDFPNITGRGKII